MPVSGIQINGQAWCEVRQTTSIVPNDVDNEADDAFLSFLILYESVSNRVFFVVHAEIGNTQYLFTGEE